MSDHSHPLATSIVRIRTGDRAVAGAGFLVAPRHIVTCAHVVVAALRKMGPEAETLDPPPEPLRLDFPLLAPEMLLEARTINWRPVLTDPPAVADPGEDTALLELITPPPPESQPARLIGIEYVWQHPFAALGFPQGHDRGVWASGVLLAARSDGWVVVEGLRNTGFFVEPGFSGGPVWDDAERGVVGMVVGAERRPEVRAAFMIPNRVLAETWPSHVLLTSDPPPTDSAPLVIVLELTGSQREQLVRALLNAFPNHGSLARLVSFSLNVSVDEVAGGSNHADVVFNLIRWAEAEGRLHELVAAALKESPRNPHLRSVAQQLSIEIESRP